MSNFENENDFLAGLKAEFEPAGNKSSNDFLAGLKDEFEPKKPQDGMWETIKAFGRDLAKVPSEIASGFGTTTDQMRMFGNFVQGDREELETLYNGLKNYAPLPKPETTIGGWIRGAANTLPYMGMSAAAGIGGGFAGGAAGSAVPVFGTAFGATGGAALASGSVGFAQGWGEMYGRLRNEGIDHDTAAGIALAVAPVYAGIEAVQVRKIPGVAQLADKYLAAPFKRMLATKLADKAFKNKVARALGSYAGEIISQSAEEGAQEMAMNTGEQYARNDGFKNFDIGENLSVGTEAFKESAGPFAVMQAAGIPFNMARRSRVQRQAQDLKNVREAVKEGREADLNEPSPSGPENIDIGGLSNLEADAAADYIDSQNAQQNNLVNHEKKKALPEQSAFDRARAAALFMKNLQNDPMNLPQGLGLQQEEALLEFMKMRAKLATAQAQKVREEQSKAQEEEKLDMLAEESLTEAQFERAKENTAKKVASLKPKMNRVAARIERITDPAERLNAIREAYELGNLDKLTDGQLESAWENGADWAERELSRRTELENSGTPLLQVMKENGFKLPTPAAIKRHAAANGRGLSSYTFGEIDDLYNSLPTNLRLRYFTKNYVNLDETAQSLRQFGFKYDSEGDFISDVADNLSGQKLSFGFSLAEDNDISNMSDPELVEAHRKAFDANDVPAGKAIAEEWMRRRGYETQAYHGTGADGFNIADATSRYEANGEGAQAHGQGLYMAANRDTSIGYMRRANKTPVVKLGGKTIDYKEMGFSSLDELIDEVYDLRENNPLGDTPKSILHSLSQKLDYWRAEEEKARKEIALGKKYGAENLKEAQEQIEYIKEDTKKLQKWVKVFGEDQTIKDLKVRNGFGRVFDWFHNMKPDELLDEDKFLSDQDPKLQKKIIKVYRELERKAPYYKAMKKAGLWADYDKKELAESTEDGRDFYRYVVDALKSRKEANALLLKHGIRGITYDGRQDGRAFVSFEGGPAVKLQDPFTFDDSGNYIPLDQRGNSTNPDMRYSIESGDYFNKAKNELPVDEDGKPNLLDVSGTDAELFQRAKEAFDAMPMFTRAADGVRIKLKVSEGGSMNSRVIHMISNNSTGQIAPHKLSWLPNIQGTIENAQIRLKGRYDTRKQGRREPNRIYIRRYGDGTIHAVVVSPYGEILGQDIKSANVITQYPVEKIGEIYNATVDWVNPKMTEAPAETTEASHIKDLSHQGTVPLPKANGPTSKGSAISDSRQLSMNAESEISPASQANFLRIKDKIDSIQKDFNRKAKVKSNVSVVQTIRGAREMLGAESLPYNARAVQTGDNIAIIAENINDADEAARIFLHEQVGHWGLRRLLGADLRPFLNYIIKHYKGSGAWNRIKQNYGESDNYTIAEEVLAHVAENRELSDPSFWRRFIQKIKRALWGNGVPQEYVNLIDEEVLRSAIALSREWAKGDHYLNANGIWAKIQYSPKGREVPDDDNLKNFSLKEIPSAAEIAEANRQKADVKAKWTNPDGSMKKGYMLAPNGKHTNLTEDQWLQVRTPNFKKWFGDWEKEAWAKAAMDFLERTAPVANLTGQEFQKNGVRLTDKVSVYFNSIGNVAHNEELGDVILNLEGIKDSIAHGIGRLKASAFMAVKDVIENGFIFNRQTNWKNRNYDSAVIVAPISINNTDYICEVVITRKPNENRFYLHEVEIKETLEKAFKTPTEGRASQASKLIIGKHIAEVKGNVSKVVDENGEPLAVYHGSTAMFNEFKSKFIGYSTGTADGRGFYFTTDKSYAEGFKAKDGRVIEAFLNIRDLLDYKKKTITKAALKKIIKEIDRAEFEADGEHYFISNFGNYYDEGIDKVIDEATESNYDFCDTDVEIFNVLITSGADFDLTAKAIKNVTGKDGEIVPKDNNTTHFIIFNSNQAKSATDNIGTFNTNNSDIRYSISEDDAARFKNELQDYIDGKLDNRHVFKLGTTPEVMRLVGADDLPVELSASVLERKEAKHSLILENLSNLPEELADPIAVMQSSTIPDAITLITELPTIDRHNMLVAVHLNKRFGKAEINSIRSIYPKTQSGIQTAINRGELRYINTKRKPSWMTLPFQHASGRKAIQRAYGHEVFTQADLSQAEKDNIFNLRAENKNFRYSIKEEKPNIYDGRFGNANRKYTRLLAQKKRELGRNISYDDLPNIVTDEEFEREVGMSKDSFASLMKERDKMGANMAHEYQKTAQKIKQSTVDRFNPIKIVEMFLNAGEPFSAEKSAYKSLLAAGNMDAVMYNAIYVGLPMFNRKKGQWEVREGTKPLIAYFDNVKGAKFANFENYAKAVAMFEHYKRKHNLETLSDAYKLADDKEFETMAGFSKQQAKLWMQEASDASKKTVKSLQEFFAANREFMVETGLASRKQADALNSFEYYIPMLRELDENDSIMSGDGGGYRSRGFSGRSSGVQPFTGSKLKTKNVMESIIERTAALYANGYKNIAMQRSIQMLSEFGLAKHAEKTSELVKARISCAKDALEKAGVRVDNIKDDSELIPLEAFHITNSLDERIKDNIVSVRANGRLIFYKINDPELLVALKALGQEQMNVLTSWLIGAKNVMTWGITKLPAFAIRNFLRDTGANTVLLGNNPAKSAANLIKALMDTPQMQKIRMSGFGGAVWYPVNANGASADFGSGIRKKHARAWKYAKNVFRPYDRILQASEQANRINAYDRAIAEGLSEAEAAFRANDVLPYNMRGSGVWTGKNIYAKSGIQILSWLIRVSPFVNAGIQGLFKAYRELGVERGLFNAKDDFSKRAKIRELAKSLNKGLMARGAILAALSVAYSIYANNSTDDDGEKWYEKLPDDDKLNYWHFYTGNNTILRIPKPFEIGYLFSTIPTAITDAFLSENPDTANILYKGLIDQMRFDLTSNPVINTYKENLKNKTSFTGSPVVERSDLNLPPQMQYNADTSATAKALSIIPSMLPWLKDSWAASPARIQNALNNFFGGMSQYGTWLSDAILQSFTDIEQPTSRYARISPITRAYDWATRDTKTMRVKNSEVFYELKGRVDELYAAARMYRQTGQLERLDALMENHEAEFGNYELINALNTRLREISTKRRKLGETKTYSTAELIELDNKLLAERNQLLQKVDLIIERIQNGEYSYRDLQEITKRIERSAANKKDSQKAKLLLRQLE